MKFRRSWNTWMTGRMCSVRSGSIAVTSIWMFRLVYCINEWLEVHVCSRHWASHLSGWIPLAIDQWEQLYKSEINGLQFQNHSRQVLTAVACRVNIFSSWHLENKHAVLSLLCRRSISYISLPCRVSVLADCSTWKSCGYMTLCFCWTVLDDLVCCRLSAQEMILSNRAL